MGRKRPDLILTDHCFKALQKNAAHGPMTEPPARPLLTGSPLGLRLLMADRAGVVRECLLVTQPRRAKKVDPC